jgi:hypothetical protein
MLDEVGTQDDIGMTLRAGEFPDVIGTGEMAYV